MYNVLIHVLLILEVFMNTWKGGGDFLKRNNRPRGGCEAGKAPHLPFHFTLCHTFPAISIFSNYMYCDTAEYIVGTPYYVLSDGARSGERV